MLSGDFAYDAILLKVEQLVKHEVCSNQLGSILFNSSLIIYFLLVEDSGTCRKADCSLLSPEETQVHQASFGEQRVAPWLGAKEGSGFRGQTSDVQSPRGRLGKHDTQGEEDREAIGETARESHSSEGHYYKVEGG